MLKSDTQGFDLEVFRGSTEMLEDGRIGMVYVEIIFSDMYQGLPRYYEICRFLEERDYKLVAIYDQHFQSNFVSWADCLFVHKNRNA